MSRVKSNQYSQNKRRKIIKAAKGYFTRGKNVYVIAKERLQRAWLYMYRDRKRQHRLAKRTAILQLSAICRQYCGVSYSTTRFILKQWNNLPSKV